MKLGPCSILVPPGEDGDGEAAPRSAIKLRFNAKSLAAARSSAAIAAALRPAVNPGPEAAANRDKLAREPAPMATKDNEFPKTKWSLVHAGAKSPEALNELCRIYRAPLEAFARRIEPDPTRAQDLVQSFLIRMLEQKVVRHADESRGRFRSYLCKALRNHAFNLHNLDNPAKRVELDFDTLTGDMPAADRLYNRAWARSLLDRALQRLRDEQRVKPDQGAVFDALYEWLDREDGGGTLLQAARKLGKSEGAVKLLLFRLRRRYYELVRAEVGVTVARPEDVDAELGELRAALRDEA